MGQSQYKRILLKLSGEVLANKDSGLSIDPEIIASTAQRLKTVRDMGVEIALVVGGGNIFRGLSGAARGIDRNSGDYMGMLATIINALALQNALEQLDVPTRVMTAITMPRVAEPFILRRALHHLSKGRIVIFGGGTGNPYFSTDTASALRASEIGASALLKATKVDGIYSADPMIHKDAVRYDSLTYQDALTQSLRVMDGAAFSLCMENQIPIVVFNFFQVGSIEAVLRGEPVGTVVS
jgi:uridylate kinase